MNPQTELELVDAITGTKSPLRIIGGGTRDIGNPVVGETLCTSSLSGIALYEPGALTIVAKAGTSMNEIEAALDVENQRLLLNLWTTAHFLEPMAHPQSAALLLPTPAVHAASQWELVAITYLVFGLWMARVRPLRTVVAL